MPFLNIFTGSPLPERSVPLGRPYSSFSHFQCVWNTSLALHLRNPFSPFKNQLQYQPPWEALHIHQSPARNTETKRDWFPGDGKTEPPTGGQWGKAEVSTSKKRLPLPGWRYKQRLPDPRACDHPAEAGPQWACPVGDGVMAETQRLCRFWRQHSRQRRKER